MNEREHLDSAIFDFIEEHRGHDYAMDYDYSAINDILDEIEGTK